MIAMLPLLAVLAAFPGSPWADGATWSVIENPDVVFPIDGGTPLSKRHPLLGAPHAALRHADQGTYLPEETAYDFISECRGNCPVPDLADIDDWQSVYTIYIGLQLEGTSQYYWPDDPQGHPRNPLWETLKHVTAVMQTAHAIFLRDAGVDLKIVHLVLSNDKLPQATATDTTLDLWENHILPQLPLGPKIQSVMRLGEMGGGSGGALCQPGLTVGHATYTLSTNPSVTGSSRNNAIQTLMHELGHQILRLEHSQCYRLPNGDPIEACHDSDCWTGATECPAFEDVSFQGYCYYCWGPSQGTGYAQLRLGPPFGPLIRVARNQVLAAAATCLDPPVSVEPINYNVDDDHDGFPNDLDNCPDLANQEQVDHDFDGIGDPCDSCAVVRPHKASAFWFLVLIPVLAATRRDER